MFSTAVRSSFIRVAPAIFVLLWSTGYVGARFGLPYADPLTLTSVRFGIVALLLTAIAVISHSPLPRSLHMWGHLAVTGILIHTTFIGATFIVIAKGVDISIAALIAGTQPLLTAIIVAPLLGEILSVRRWAGFVLGFAGLAMVVLKSIQLGGLSVAELLLCILALCGITFGTIYQKRYVVGIDLWAGSAIQFGVAFLVCLSGAQVLEAGRLEWNPTLVMVLIWLCLALSIGAISVLLFLIREGAASKVSSLFYLVPPVTALQGYVFFGERLTSLQLVGIGVTAIGVALINAPQASDAK